MAIVNLVSNLRAYNPKFINFSVTQVVDQPIPAEPNRTAPSNLDSRLDDYDRLEAFLASGKGRTFIAKQAVLDQAARGTTVKERIGEAANTAARLTNILFQVAPKATRLTGLPGVPQDFLPGEIVRFSSHPFLRYIEARGVREQIGNLFRVDAPSLALRGKTIIPDNEYSPDDEGEGTDQSAADNTPSKRFSKIRNFIKNRVDFYNNVRESEAFTKNIEENSTSLKSTFSALEGGKFNKSVGAGYVVEPAEGSRKPEFRKRVPTGTEVKKSFITDQSVGGNVPVSNTSAKRIDENSDSLRSRLSSADSNTNLKPGFNDIANYEQTNSIRTKARGASRVGGVENNGFKDRQPYITYLGDLSNPEKNRNNDILLKFDPYTARYTNLNAIYFTATLEDFSDSYSSNWNNTQYIGRGEPVYNFNSTSRTIGFSFKAYSTSAREVRGLYKRLNQLASYTNPTYTGTFMAGTFIKLTLGDYLIATPGFLTSVDFKWQTSYPWEVTGTEKSILDSQIYEISTIPKLPHILDVSIGFTPIHNFIPEANPDNVNRAFIASRDIVNGASTENPLTNTTLLPDSPPEQADTNAENPTNTSTVIPPPAPGEGVESYKAILPG